MATSPASAPADPPIASPAQQREQSQTLEQLASGNPQLRAALGDHVNMPFFSIPRKKRSSTISLVVAISAHRNKIRRI